MANFLRNFAQGALESADRYTTGLVDAKLEEVRKQRLMKVEGAEYDRRTAGDRARQDTLRSEDRANALSDTASERAYRTGAAKTQHEYALEESAARTKSDSRDRLIGTLERERSSVYESMIKNRNDQMLAPEQRQANEAEYLTQIDRIDKRISSLYGDTPKADDTVYDTPPKAGDVVDNPDTGEKFRFLGGNPNDKSRYELVTESVSAPEPAKASAQGALEMAQQQQQAPRAQESGSRGPSALLITLTPDYYQSRDPVKASVDAVMDWDRRARGLPDHLKAQALRDIRAQVGRWSTNSPLGMRGENKLRELEARYLK